MTDRSIKVSEDALMLIRKVAGTIQGRTGKKTTMDQAVKAACELYLEGCKDSFFAEVEKGLRKVAGGST